MGDRPREIEGERVRGRGRELERDRGEDQRDTMRER